MNNHTPTPWQVTDYRSGICVATNNFIADETPDHDPEGSDDWSIASCEAGLIIPRGPDECEANAAFIVTAVNNHDALVTALVRASNLIDTFAPFDSAEELATSKQITAALAAVEGDAVLVSAWDDQPNRRN